MNTKLGEGVSLSPDLLATIRRVDPKPPPPYLGLRRFSPGHDAEDAGRPSYLISVQTVGIPPFTETETRLLLTDPLQRSPLYARDAERRPRLEVQLLGEQRTSRRSTRRRPDGLTSSSSSPAAPSTSRTRRRPPASTATRWRKWRYAPSSRATWCSTSSSTARAEWDPAERAYIAGFRTKDSRIAPGRRSHAAVSQTPRDHRGGRRRLASQVSADATVASDPRLTSRRSRSARTSGKLNGRKNPRRYPAEEPVASESTPSSDAGPRPCRSAPTQPAP